MARWFVLTVMLSGCSPSPAPALDLAEVAANIERRCGLASGSILHPTPRRDLEVRLAGSTMPTYSQFSCTMTAIKQERLEALGVRVFVVGEQAAQWDAHSRRSWNAP